jgi:hypothetical protein
MEINKGSQEGFMRWLNTFTDDEIIGYAWDPFECPLQHYLKSLNPTLKVSVGGGVHYWNDNEMFHSPEVLEQWQIVVVKITDRIGGAITKKDFIESFSKGKKDGNK